VDTLTILVSFVSSNIDEIPYQKGKMKAEELVGVRIKIPPHLQQVAGDVLVKDEVHERGENTPLLLRRMRPRPIVPDVFANMTIVTTQNHVPEMGDQTEDATAPRND